VSGSLASRRGTSLAELLVALTMLGVVAAVLFGLLAGNLRLYHSQTQYIDRAQNIRAAAILLTTELRELNATEGDIYAASPDRMSFRAMRQLGFACREPQPGATQLAIRDQPVFGIRDFDPGTDSLLIYATGDSADDGEWLVAALTGRQPGRCADGNAAVLLETHSTLDRAADPGTAPRRILDGAPVRGFEPVTYRLYRAGDGEWHIGLAAGGAVIQPVVGPVTATGLEFVYRDPSGALVNDPAAIASIEIRLRMPTAQRVRGPDGRLVRAIDSLDVVVALRNNR
jgi:type II secretory pathway pseudopilin PulG